MSDPWQPAATRGRRTALSARLEGPLLVTDLDNIRYLTGFSGSNGALLIGPETCRLFTDSRYADQAATEAPEVPVTITRDLFGAALSEVDGPLLLEGHQVAAATWERLRAEHEVALSPDVVAELRAVKETAEVAAIEQACQISERALNELLAEGLGGRSERDIARRLAWLLAGDGGEGPGFDSIVASGPNSAIPHHQPTDRIVERGDLVKIDFGARYLGYHADITRTFVVGPAAAWQAELHGIVEAAQQAGREAVAAGVEIAAVDEAARAIITEAGHAEHFGHGLGHGVGLAIHERPLIAARVAGKLLAGMTVTVEPGIYLTGRGGVRIEDIVLVTADGHRSLVGRSRDLVSIE